MPAAVIVEHPATTISIWKGIAKALKDIKYDGDVVIESFTTDVKVIARAAAIWRLIEPTQDEIAVKGLKFLQRTL